MRRASAWKGFKKVWGLVVNAGLLKKIKNPMARSVFEFWTEMDKDFGEAWAVPVSEAGACARLGSALGQVVVFDVATLPDDAVLPVHKRLVTLLNGVKAQPDWVLRLMERADGLVEQDKQRRQAAAAAKAAGAPAGSTAPAPAVDAPAGAGCAAPAPILPARSAVEEGEFYVGDVVLVGGKNKKLKGDAVHKKKLNVRMLAGPKEDRGDLR